ncbi:UDP-glucose/GDP-mannose dehydrogenase family protein [bacterium]|nr:UDP-glucose/GDP-mannose dehydrogenase family protein [bacterium]
MKNITVIGTGYVGLVSGAGLSDFGNQVVCADIDESKISLLQTGKIPIFEPGLKEVVDRNVKSNRLSFTVDVSKAIRDSEVIFIGVGTPEGKNGEADLSAVFSVAEMIGKNLNSYKIICTKSTVPIGTGAKIISLINKFKKKDVEFDYVSNPEFLREGAAVQDFLIPNRIVLGTNSQKAFQIMQDVYRPLFINDTPIVFTNVPTAEMIKYASNAFLALKISYINEIANVCEAVGADVHIVAKAMGNDGRISPKFLHPGPGFGGSCFPKDTKALLSLSKELNEPMNTVAAAIVTNNRQKERMIDKLFNLMGNAIKGKTIAVLGLSFKQMTDDVRESASIEMIQSIIEKNGTVKAYDPVAIQNIKKHFPDIEYSTSWQTAVKDTDAVVIMTEWHEFRGLDLVELKQLVKTPIILDTRNVLSIKDLTSLGFKFDNVGRKAVK